MNLFDWQNTTFEIEDAEIDVAILPVAACEQHGEHLPVGTDQMIVDAISRRVAQALDGKVWLLPTMPLGTSGLHGGVPGTVWLGEETLYQVIYDVVESLYEHNISRVVIINNHGGAAGTTVIPHGNYIVKTAARQLNYDHPGNATIWVQPFPAAKEDLMQIFESAGEDIHAGEVETSVMLHLAAGLVKGRGEDHIPAVTNDYLDYAPFKRLSSSGVWGRPSLASAQKGAQAFDAAAQATIAYVEESFAHLDRLKAMKI